MKTSSTDKHLSLEYDHGMLNFFSYEWWVAERDKKEETPGKSEMAWRKKMWNDYVKRTIEDAHVIIEGERFIKGSKENLEKYGIKLISK